MTNQPRCNEETTAYLTVSFYDKAGALENPVSATWEAHDVKSGTELQSATALAPVGGQVEITIPTTVNTMVDPNLEEEVRRITVKALYSGVDGVNDKFDYTLVNLSAVT